MNKNTRGTLVYRDRALTFSCKNFLTSMEETQSRFHDVHEDATLQPSSMDKTDLCPPAKKLNRTERVASLKESSAVHDAHTFEPEGTMHVVSIFCECYFLPKTVKILRVFRWPFGRSRVLMNLLT